jgi:hypothetical protein
MRHLIGSLDGAGPPLVAVAECDDEHLSAASRADSKDRGHEYRAHQFDSRGKVIVDLEDLDS